MELTQALENFLYQVASALYLPVIAGCSLLVVYVPWMLGMLLRDAWDRRRGRFRVRERFVRALDGEVASFRGRAGELPIRVERLLQQAELEMARQLDRVRFVIKTGPALGLMGTLIPMGISLAALAQGDIPKMAGSMVTAFTATVGGLGAGVAAYLIALVRERWVRADIREMAFAAEIAAGGGEARAAHQPIPETGDALPHTA